MKKHKIGSNQNRRKKFLNSKVYFMCHSSGIVKTIETPQLEIYSKSIDNVILKGKL